MQVRTQGVELTSVVGPVGGLLLVGVGVRGTHDQRGGDDPQARVASLERAQQVEASQRLADGVVGDTGGDDAAEDEGVYAGHQARPLVVLGLLAYPSGQLVEVRGGAEAGERRGGRQADRGSSDGGDERRDLGVDRALVERDDDNVHLSCPSS